MRIKLNEGSNIAPRAHSLTRVVYTLVGTQTLLPTPRADPVDSRFFYLYRYQGLNMGRKASTNNKAQSPHLHRFLETTPQFCIRAWSRRSRPRGQVQLACFPRFSPALRAPEEIEKPICLTPPVIYLNRSALPKKKKEANKHSRHLQLVGACKEAAPLPLLPAFPFSATLKTLSPPPNSRVLEHSRHVLLEAPSECEADPKTSPFTAGHQPRMGLIGSVLRHALERPPACRRWQL